jgi:hypothetical protein
MTLAQRLAALLEHLRERCAETAEGISSDYPESARDTAEAIRAIELDVAVRRFLEEVPTLTDQEMDKIWSSLGSFSPNDHRDFAKQILKAAWSQA